MGEKPSFQVSLARILADHQEVEIVGVFRNLLGEVGLRRRQGAIKIGLSPPLTAIQATLDLMHQDIAAPPMLDCRSQVPLPFRGIFDLVEQHAIWNHGICAAACCTNCSVGQTSAKERMYFRLRGENPCVPGNARFKSLDRRSMTFAPHFCCAWRSRISRPICQYSRTNSRFTARPARSCASRIRSFKVSRSWA